MDSTQGEDASDTDSCITTDSIRDRVDDKFRRVKVRTGCSTCKARHVKCDEQKPACLRCSSTGRRCPGYASTPPSKERVRRSKYDCDNPLSRSNTNTGRKTISGVSRNGTNPELTPDSEMSRFSCNFPPSPGATDDFNERRSFYYFRTRASHAISGYFETDFWNYLVLQVGHTEPTVRYALLALSSLYEAQEISQIAQSPSSHDQYNFLKGFAVKQYMKAVRLLSSVLPQNGTSPTVILVSCLIFIWLEFVQDDLDAALLHLRSGLQILSEQKARSIYLDQNSTIAPIIRLFTRLETQATLHGSPKSSFQINNDTIKPIQGAQMLASFSNILDARSGLDDILVDIFRFHRLIEQPGFLTQWCAIHSFPDPLSIEAQRQMYLTKLEMWHTALLGSPIYSKLPSYTSNTASAIAQLELQHHLARNTLQTLFATTPLAFDLYTEDFAHMVCLSRTLLQPRTPTRTEPPVPSPFVLAFDVSTMAPLLYVVIKCRVLDVRTEALTLISDCPEREGMWDRESVLQFAQWKVKFEEARRCGEKVLPAEARIWAEKVKDVDRHGAVVLKFKRGVCQSHSQSTHDGKGVQDYEEVVTNLSMRLAGLIGT